MSDDNQQNAGVTQGPQKASLKTAVGEINLENVSLNTFFTLIGFLLIVLISFALWEHREDSKSHGREIVVTFKEMVAEQKMMTQAMRESNCLTSLSPEERKRDSELCKRVTR